MAAVSQIPTYLMTPRYVLLCSASGWSVIKNATSAAPGISAPQRFTMSAIVRGVGDAYTCFLASLTHKLLLMQHFTKWRLPLPRHMYMMDRTASLVVQCTSELLTSLTTVQAMLRYTDLGN